MVDKDVPIEMGTEKDEMSDEVEKKALQKIC
jgi:hypothetical protein